MAINGDGAQATDAILCRRGVGGTNGTDARIDAYIAKAALFARPILTLRHDDCPTATDTIKWGAPHFTYKDKMLPASPELPTGRPGAHSWRI